MSIQRQYSLPNCTLVLDGMGEDIAGVGENEGRPQVSILMNMECRFVGINERISGGKALLENLVKAVNHYAQECLSGLSRPQDTAAIADQVYLEKIPDSHLHRLCWYPSTDDPPQRHQIDLSTVQLFDLVEAVDQFFADSRTLPDISLTLQPISRHYRQPDEPLAQRVVPAVVGICSVAIAGLIFYAIPQPEMSKPEPKVKESPTETLPSPDTSPIP